MSNLPAFFQNLQKAQELLSDYHGWLHLKNVSTFTSSNLYKDLVVSQDISLSLDTTVKSALDQIAHILKSESIQLQLPRFQEAIRTNAIVSSKRLEENQRVEFFHDSYLYEWAQLMFSPAEFYFTINSLSFKKDDKKYNHGVFQNALESLIIDPSYVAPSSLESLHITLAPDCQNLKEIFKNMTPLQYQDADKQRRSARIYSYEGKYIVFVAHKTVFDTLQPATKWEQRKADVRWHMSVYPDIFSMIRKEEYIIEGNQEKQRTYQELKKKILSSLREIDWNKKEYSIRVQQNVQEIIAEIDGATSVKIMADKLYHLYKITGKHSERDKKLLEASMRNFTQRIAQLMGISSYTHLHLIEFNDALEKQSTTLELFYSQIALFFGTPKKSYDKILLAFETYSRAQKWPLQEPFHTFHQQIQQCFGDVSHIKNPRIFVFKVATIIFLQRKYRETYLWEHQYKEGDLSLQDLENKLLDSSSDTIFKQKYPEAYATLFTEIYEGRGEFSPEFTPWELNAFFAKINDLKELQSTIDAILSLM